jgi:hypothetical protein
VSGGAEQSGPFNARIIIGVVAAAIVSFVGYLFLSAYAPDMKGAGFGRSHALSNAAIGYSGIVKLRKALGLPVSLSRAQADEMAADILILTPELDTDPKALAALAHARSGGGITLIVLPKRAIRPSFEKPGWVQGRQTAPVAQIKALLAPLGRVALSQHRAAAPEAYGSDWAPTYRFPRGTVIQTMESDALEGYISDDEGRMILGGLLPKEKESSPYLYILSDPDVLNNLGIRIKSNAAAANGILEGLLDTMKDEKNAHVPTLAFDLTLNGYTAGGSLLKLAFEPPFLALSLCLFVASIMALLHGLMRFGPPLREARAIERGKGVLVGNVAALLKLAKREGELGERYAALTRDSAATALGLPLGMSNETVRDRLDRLTQLGAPFSVLEANATQAKNSIDMLAAARALYHWRKDKSA